MTYSSASRTFSRRSRKLASTRFTVAPCEATYYQDTTSFHPDCGLCPLSEISQFCYGCSQASPVYFNSTRKTSPRQFVPIVQVADPDSEPSVPIQSEDTMKNLPSCEMLPMPYSVLNLCE